MNDTVPSAQSALAQPLTEELIARSGIAPGMRVVVLGSGTGDLAFLVAERVGPGGRVIGVDDDPCAAALARRRAREQRFAHVSLYALPLERVAFEDQVDAVIGRFYLMRQPDPVAAIRCATKLVRPGGRISFQEWHFESTLWQHASAWPDVPLYSAFARFTVDALLRAGSHPDMGLRLVNAMVAAGLPVPAIRTDLRALEPSNAATYGFFTETILELLPSARSLGASVPLELQESGFAERLRCEVAAGGGHAFLPLQVGAWTRRQSSIESCVTARLPRLDAGR